jgi:Phage integrase family
MLPSMWKMRKDLERAQIPYMENGRRADFHALRHTLATNLVRHNVAPRAAMQILRHSDICLTMNHYTDASQLPVIEAIEKLPRFGSADKARADTQRHSQTTDISSERQSSRDTKKASSESSKVLYPEEFWHGRTPTGTAGHSEDENCLARIRT